MSDVKTQLYIIFALRKESYEGQHAPEALEIMDEWAYEGNPEWLNKKLAEYQKDDEFTKVELVTVNVSQDGLEKIMRPKNELVGKIDSLPEKAAYMLSNVLHSLEQRGIQLNDAEDMEWLNATKIMESLK